MDLDRADLRKLLDREAIRDAAARYARGINRHDDDLFRSAYHPDAIDDHGTSIGELKGLIEHCNEAHASNWSSHTPDMMKQTIDLEGDVAHVESYFLIALRRKDGPVDMVGGRWIDRFERRQSRWAIAARVVVTDWNGELAQAHAPMDPDLFIRGSWDKNDVSYQRPLD